MKPSILCGCAAVVLVTAILSSCAGTKAENLAVEVDIQEIKEDVVGVVMPEVDYASQNTLIFHGHFGLFVYDINEAKITKTLSLREIDSNYMQGSVYTEVQVNEEGNIIYIDNIGDGLDDVFYVYDVDQGLLTQETLFVPANVYKKHSIYDKADFTLNGWKSDMIGRIDENTFAYLHMDSDKELVKDLSIVVVNESTQEYSIAAIFE